MEGEAPTTTSLTITTGVTMATTKYDLAHDCLVEMLAKIEPLLGKEASGAIYNAAYEELSYQESQTPPYELPFVHDCLSALKEVAL